MFLRYTLLIVVILAGLLAFLSFRYPGHAAIVITLLYDVINTPPSMKFDALGIDSSRINASDASKSYVRDKLFEKFPVGSELAQVRDGFQSAGMTCKANVFDHPDDHFETTLSNNEKGDVFSCSGEFGGSRVTPCYMFVDVQTDMDERVSDYWVNIGCTGP